jgi:hypothetical protein
MPNASLNIVYGVPHVRSDNTPLEGENWAKVTAWGGLASVILLCKYRFGETQYTNGSAS